MLGTWVAGSNNKERNEKGKIKPFDSKYLLQIYDFGVGSGEVCCHQNKFNIKNNFQQ
jgi:hypothetical protein